VIVIRHSITGRRVREYRIPNPALVVRHPAHRVCRMEREMIKSRILSAALVAAAMFATPAMACASHGASRHIAADAHAGVGARQVDGAVGIRAPRVGAHAAPASAAATCDVGDSERIC